MNRVVYLDYLRLLATIGVVVIHVALSFVVFNKCEINTTWMLVNVVESFVRWSVPIFLMISGVSFLCIKEELSYKTLYKKYILRLLIVYLFWNLFYYMCSCAAAYLRGVPLPDPACLLTPFGHLWFLPMMVGIYMVMPLLRTIQNENRGGVFLTSLGSNYDNRPYFWGKLPFAF